MGVEIAFLRCPLGVSGHDWDIAGITHCVVSLLRNLDTALRIRSPHCRAVITGHVVLSTAAARKSVLALLSKVAESNKQGGIVSAFGDKVQGRLDDLMSTAWVIRDGQVVPNTEDVALKNGAVKLEATYLYADLAESTLLQKRYKPEFAAKVVRMYLAGASEVIRELGGSIKSFDGDRVMGIFIGSSMRNDAVNAALKINHMVDQMMNPTIKRRLEASKSAQWVVSHGIGIDSGPAFIARAGVHNRSGGHNHNDLISIGEAPNIAAKLSGLRGVDKGPIAITARVYQYLNDTQKFGGTPKQHMWRDARTVLAGPHSVVVRQSGWRRSL